MISIGEIATALTGFPFDSKLFNETKGFPLIRIRNLKEGRTDTFFDGDFDKAFLIRKGDLLIGMDGEFNLVEWQSDDALLNQRVMKVIPNEKLVSKGYLKYALPKRLKEIEDSTPFVTVKHLSHKKVLDSKIPLPDLKTQQKIASILAQADAARQKRKQANQLTEQFLQSAFLEMFGDPVRNEKGWEVKRLEEISIKITDGVHAKPTYVQSGIPFISVKDITTGQLKFDSCKFISKEAHQEYIRRCKPEIGDILYTKVGATYGRPAIVDTKDEFSLYVSVALIKPNSEKIISLYLREFLRSNYAKWQADQAISGIGVPDLHLVEIKKFFVPVPPIPLQQKFATLVEQVERLRTKQRESERELDNLFQSLMQRYFG